MNGFADLHSHFVYGVDDGAKTKAEMESMLDRAHAEGITTLAATAHVVPGLRPFDEELFRMHCAEAESYCRSKGYAIRLIPGAEVFYTPAADKTIYDHRLPALGETDYILVEFLPDVRFADLKRVLDQMTRCAYFPVLAHAERYGCLHWERNMSALRENRGVRVQINAGRVIDSEGFWNRRRLQQWIEKDWVDLIASDAHGPKHRPFCMKEAYKRIAEEFGTEKADRLTGRKGSIL